MSRGHRRTDNTLAHRRGVRIAIGADFFLPLMSGARNLVLRVLEHLQLSVPLAGYGNVRVASGGVTRVKRILADFAPDVVHLASPFVLSGRAAQAVHQLGNPSMAFYPTAVSSFAACRF